MGAEAELDLAVRSKAHETQSLPLNLTSYFNNQGFGTRAGESSFDILNQSYPAVEVGKDGIYTSGSGIDFHAPGYRGPSTPDNLICEGQTIAVHPGKYFSLSILHSSDVREATVSGNVTFNYADNTTSKAELRSEPWWAFLTINRGEVIYPGFFKQNTTDYNTSHIFPFSAALEPGKVLESITLPVTTNATTGRIHIFSMSLWTGSGVQVQSIRPTQKWTGNGTQIVEVTINNSGHECVHGSALDVSISGSGIKTVVNGQLKRLCPGDQKRVDVGVTGSGNCSVTVSLGHGKQQEKKVFHDVEFGLTNWTDDLDNLAQHESPEWFDGAKYGIFIHWGVYAVPGWGNSTPYESYAEWFWWYSTHHPQADRSDFYDYRLRTFGPDWNYDDSFVNYTAANFDPKEWVDLFADAGAKYFVFTSKHHDGFANFDTGNTTHRNAIHYGPHRDILKELFDASAQYQPSLKRGTYFSLPEWFNPDFEPYGIYQFATNSSTTWPGVIAKNPYTGLEEPYTGRLPINDFITDLMVPQMDILAYTYETDIMWCDTGGANGTAEFAARWFNSARAQNRQVTINSRCGLAHVNDFDTPEYATFATPQARKWESNQGMDPYSYGYNRATPDEAYMNASTIVSILVDMVSKNGNLLLDIGPRADGSIVQAEIDNLREAGKWIHVNEEAIFNTTYWFVQAEVVSEDTNIRFTQTQDAFYILSLEKPQNGSLVVDAPVPILKGDKLTLLGLGANATNLSWTKNGEGIKINVPESAVDAVQYCWVFKVAYTA